MSATAGCGARAPQGGSDDEGGKENKRRMEVESTVQTYVAVAEVVYPTTLSGIETFVRSFIAARLDREERGTAMRDAVTELQTVADEWYDSSFESLAPETRDSLLRELGVDEADEDPDGTVSARVRFYVVNELLLALYSSPTGGELVGIENPQGHPGGTDTYQRGPSR
ncbi:gluconate 2-dehydrogenase subunit 3 family protein [Halovenus rubra]|uniref:Gluconate 2-dehydrogenase subunit 3 family protein n=2 Tax=Halovenus rubra TaxID=869890 RepID=A0ABD5X552_9EURY